MRTITFFNNKGGVGKTTLVYHLSWMLQELGHRVVVLDLDPQANLTAAFLNEDRLLELWPNGSHPKTVFGALEDLNGHLGDIRQELWVEPINDRLGLIPGDLALSRFEDRLAETWPKCLSGDPDAFRVATAFYRIAALAAGERLAEVVLLDVGPSLGPLNRAALVASDYVVVPLAADLFSLQGLRNLGPTLRKWRADWEKRKVESQDPALVLPEGLMRPAGYVLLQHAVRSDRPTKAYEPWARRIPEAFRVEMLGEPPGSWVAETDVHQLASLKHYRSLMPLAQEARKPIFFLKAADGAIGSHAAAVSACYSDFSALATRLLEVCPPLTAFP